jgi:hypothetical protein
MTFVGSAAQAKKAKAPRPPKAVTTLVLPLKARGLDRQAASTLGKRMGAALVREMKDLGVIRLLMGKDVSTKLKQLKAKKVMVPKCLSDRRCIRAVGNSFKAKVIFHMRLAKAEGGVSVTLRSFDVRSGKEVRKVVELASMEPDDVERAARWAARKVASPVITTLLKGKGRLEVACDQEGADLFLNGKSFGKRTNKSFKVGAGVFDVQVKKEGFATFHDVVVVKPRQDHKVQAQLKALDKPAAAVVASGTEPDDEVPEPADQVTPKPDLPAWAIFEKKPKPDPGAAATEPKPTGPVVAKVTPQAEAKPAPKAQPKPFVPSGDDPLDQPIEKIDDDDSRWYQTWWFWTIVGVGVAGATAGGLVAGGVFDSGSTSPTGAALISWQ